MRSLKTYGIIIKRTNFGEADRILTVFSKHLGKIKVLAKGVRKITSRRSGSVELFNLSSLTLYRSKDFLILTEAETIKSFPSIRNSLKLIGLAYHVCEIVEKLTAEHQENHEVFELLLEVLKKMDDIKMLPKEEKEKLIRNFEINLLQSLGFLPKQEIDPDFNTRAYIEELTEKELKSKKFIARLA